jgi:hypothetical protein
MDLLESKACRTRKARPAAGEQASPQVESQTCLSTLVTSILRIGRWRAAGCLAGIGWLLCACNQPSTQWLGTQDEPDRLPRTLRDADTGFTAFSTSNPNPSSDRPSAGSVRLTVLQVFVPSDGVEQAALIWNHVREEVLDSETVAHLRRNGLRIGLGHDRWWEPVRATLDAIPDCRISQSDPVLLRAGFPLVLELDPGARDQTLFWMDRAGSLSGCTWTQSRNTLRIYCAPDSQVADRVALRAVPAVWQRGPGSVWAQNERGPWELVPNQSLALVSGISIALSLDPGEFAVIAPSDDARVPGLIGSEFLTGVMDGRRYGSFIFLHPEVKRVRVGRA